MNEIEKMEDVLLKLRYMAGVFKSRKVLGAYKRYMIDIAHMETRLGELKNAVLRNS